MAGDWIKMRSDLFTHPKVVRISSAFKTDTLRTVGGLMSVWCLFDAHSVDGKLHGYDRATLDAHVRWPGFSDALMGVNWLEQDGETLVLPRFDAHNGQSAKRRAQEADRKRDVRKSSALEADIKRTREEKRREDISPSLRSGDSAAKPRRVSKPILGCPQDVDQQTWADWQQLRKTKKAPVTETVLKGAREEAGKAGMTLTEFLAVWCRRGSQGLEADWLKPSEKKVFHEASGETPYQRSMREKMQSAVPDIAARAPGQKQIIDVEAANVTPLAVGR